MRLANHHYSGFELWKKLNEFGGQKTKFLFIIDFLGREGYIIPLEIASELDIYFQTIHYSNSKSYSLKSKNLKPDHNLDLRTNVQPISVKDSSVFNRSFRIDKHPVSLAEYKKAFNRVQLAQRAGESYLLNLTFPTPIKLSHDLGEIFQNSESLYKLFIQNQLLVFSPEPFVKIEDGVISSYPMKGTGVVTEYQAYDSVLRQILVNEKETAEHATIVDLIRNDLSKIARRVKVDRYRYPETISLPNTTLIQLSTQISGIIEGEYEKRLGDILYSLLPAGSVSGAPKKRTLELITEIEPYKRGYYSGVFGVFDGINLDSAVMIRYIEKEGEKYVYKSGGGITAKSIAEEEYEELKQKIYVPIFRNA